MLQRAIMSPRLTTNVPSIGGASIHSPFTLLYLQAPGGVLVEQGDAAVVGVGPGALLLGGSWRCDAAGSEIMRNTLTGSRKRVSKKSRSMPSANVIARNKVCARGLHVDVVLLHQRFPTGQRWMAVGAAQRFFRQHIGVVGRQVQAHVESFFQVAGFARVQLFGGDGAIAAMVAGLGDVDLELLGRGQGEETLGAVEHGVDARGADRVTLDIEEAPFAAGVVDCALPRLPRRFWSSV